MTDPGNSAQVPHLDLCIEVPGSAGGLTVVAILVDGAQIFSSVCGRHYRGWHPALILDPDDEPLLPARPSRRVGLYPRASLHAAEGCVTAVILTAGDRIAWTDIRDRGEGAWR